MYITWFFIFGFQLTRTVILPTLQNAIGSLWEMIFCSRPLILFKLCPWKRNKSERSNNNLQWGYDFMLLNNKHELLLYWAWVAFGMHFLSSYSILSMLQMYKRNKWTKKKTIILNKYVFVWRPLEPEAQYNYFKFHLKNHNWVNRVYTRYWTYNGFFSLCIIR